MAVTHGHGMGSIGFSLSLLAVCVGFMGGTFTMIMYLENPFNQDRTELAVPILLMYVLFLIGLMSALLSRQSKTN